MMSLQKVATVWPSYLLSDITLRIGPVLFDGAFAPGATSWLLVLDGCAGDIRVGNPGVGDRFVGFDAAFPRILLLFLGFL